MTKTTTLYNRKLLHQTNWATLTQWNTNTPIKIVILLRSAEVPHYHCSTTTRI